MVKQRAFTLIELLIAASILVVVMVAIYSAFYSGIFGCRGIDDIIEAHQVSRAILERVNIDLKNSFAYKDKSGNAKFTGSGHEVSFLTLVDTFVPLKKINLNEEGFLTGSGQENIVRDFALVSYKLEGNKLFRRVLKAQEALNQDSQARPEEMADNVVDIVFQYGKVPVATQKDKDLVVDFKDTWVAKDDPDDEQGVLPVAVKISLIVKKGKIEYEFKRVVYLPRGGEIPSS